MDTEMNAASPPKPPTHDRRKRIKRRARAQFEKWATSYDRSLFNELVFFPTIRTCQEEILRWQARREPAPYRLLDVGCGTGTLLTVLARDPLAQLLVGLDYTAAMARRMAEKAARCDGGPRLYAVQADSEHLPFADRSFDVITCCHSFHHYPHQAAVLRGFRRVLRPGGLLILVDGFRDNVIGWVVFDVFVAAVERHVHHASWSQLRTMILEAGFSELAQRKLNVLAPLLANIAMA
jgi:ubiquinone/menaquinone biosynthesis C-methylase UbiE